MDNCNLRNHNAQMATFFRFRVRMRNVCFWQPKSALKMEFQRDTTKLTCRFLFGHIYIYIERERDTYNICITIRILYQANKYSQNLGGGVWPRLSPLRPARPRPVHGLQLLRLVGHGRGGVGELRPGRAVGAVEAKEGASKRKGKGFLTHRHWFCPTATRVSL